MNAPQHALRANTGKPELSYLLTFKGAIAAAFDESEFCEGLELLSDWYNSDEDKPGMWGESRLWGAASQLLFECGDNWPADLARVSTYGASKYARGNYLAGMSWSWILDCLLRHIDALQRGEENDKESGCKHTGHIAWNICYLVHCVELHKQFDDRIRPPAKADDKQLTFTITGTAPDFMGGLPFVRECIGEKALIVPGPGDPPDVREWWRHMQNPGNGLIHSYNPHEQVYIVRGPSGVNYCDESQDLAVCAAVLGEKLAHAVYDSDGNLHELQTPGTL